MSKTLRAVGQLAVFGALYLAFLILYRMVMGPVHHGDSLRDVLEVPALLLISTACAVLLAHRRATSIGYGLFPGALPSMAKGLCLGAVGMGTVALLLALTGAVQYRPAVIQASALALLPLGYMVGAASEELLFRGYPLQTLASAWGAAPAAIALSLAFGAVHLNNPGMTSLAFVNTVMAGFCLSVAYFRTRALWLPFGLHLGWNVAQNLLGLTVSGDLVAGSTLLLATNTGADWLTGGPYGPEGGLVTSLVLVVALGWLGRTPRLQPHEWE